MTSERFIVRELEGWLTTRKCGSNVQPGLSVMVLDTLYAHRVVRSFRTEERRHIVKAGPHESVRARVRRLGAEEAAHLNRQHAP